METVAGAVGDYSLAQSSRSTNHRRHARFGVTTTPLVGFGPTATTCTRSEGDDLEESAARALMRHGEDVVGEVIALAQVRGLANSLDYDTGEIPNWWD